MEEEWFSVSTFIRPLKKLSISFPNCCACCCGPSDSSIPLTCTVGKSFDGMSRTYHNETVNVPYCRRCVRHIRLRRIFIFSSALGVFSLTVLLYLMFTLISEKGAKFPNWIVLTATGGMSLLGCLSCLAWYRLAKSVSKKGCADLAPAVKMTIRKFFGTSDIEFRLKNRSYAEKFKELEGSCIFSANIEMLKDDHTRFEALINIEYSKDIRYAKYLVELLRVDRYSKRALAALQKITGQNLGLDPRAWQEWLESK